MLKYIIEREIPGAGKLTAEELSAISQGSCGVLNKMGPQIQWVQSYVTPDKLYCIYLAPNKEMILEYTQQGGFPANVISEVATIIDRTTPGQRIFSRIYINQVQEKLLQKIWQQHAKRYSSLAKIWTKHKKIMPNQIPKDLFGNNTLNKKLLKEVY